MDEDAPTLIGSLKSSVLPCASNNNNSNNTSCSYAPPLALFPEIATASVQPSLVPSSLGNVSGLDRSSSSWNIAALQIFRGVQQNQNQNQQQQQKKITAREALSIMASTGRLPGVDASSKSAMPSAADILNGLNKFALEVGANEEDCAALRSQHFLHLLGFQRLEQLRGNLYAFGVASSSSSAASASAVPAQMFQQQLQQQQQQQQKGQNQNQNQNNKKNKKETKQEQQEEEEEGGEWVAERTKLHEAVLKLLGEQQEQQQSTGNASAFPISLWATPAPKTSSAIQTLADNNNNNEQNWEGTINLDYREGQEEDENNKNKNSNQQQQHKAKEQLPFLCNRKLQEGASGGLVLNARVFIVEGDTEEKKQQQQLRDENKKQEQEEDDFVQIRLTAPRVSFGRHLSSGSIRRREGEHHQQDNENSNNNNNNNATPDPWHVDLSSVVRRLVLSKTNQQSEQGEENETNKLLASSSSSLAGKCVSRLHFVIVQRQQQQQQQIDLIPHSKNFLRVNGSVVYGKPYCGIKSGDRITLVCDVLEGGRKKLMLELKCE